jgi:hypothetical protein
VNRVEAPQHPFLDGLAGDSAEDGGVQGVRVAQEELSAGA